MMTRWRETINSVLLMGLIYLACSGFCFSLAAELDSFTNRDPDLHDITPQVNAFINDKILAALPRVRGCNEQELYRIVHVALSVEFMGALEMHLVTNPKIPHILTPLEDSIYRDFVVDDAPALLLVPFAMNPLIKVAGVLTGADKFGHFFAEGYRYFQKVYREGQTVKDALVFGWQLEDGFLGAGTTGIFSHGDLAANYRGMQFWRNLIAPHAITEKPPLIACRNGRYKLARRFDAAEFVDEAWDEALNCNRYRNNRLAGLVESRLNELQKFNTCPIDLSACSTMKQKYGPNAAWVINPVCLQPRARNR